MHAALMVLLLLSEPREAAQTRLPGAAVTESDCDRRITAEPLERLDNAALRAAFAGHRTVVCGSGAEAFRADGLWVMNSRVRLDGVYFIENDELCVLGSHARMASCRRYGRDSAGRLYLTYVSDIGTEGVAWEVILRPIDD